MDDNSDKRKYGSAAYLLSITDTNQKASQCIFHYEKYANQFLDYAIKYIKSLHTITRTKDAQSLVGRKNNSSVFRLRFE